jgi:DNA-binding NarL/FixJ family response regulator
VSSRRTVVVASGDRLFGESVARHLHGRGWEATTAEDGIATLASIRRTTPHAVLVLGGLARLDTTGLAGQIHRRWQGIRVVAVGGDPAPGVLTLSGSASSDEVAAALSTSGPTLEESSVLGGIDDLVVLRSLTRRELAVLRLLGRGLDTRGIAESLGISVHTVRTHLQHLYAKLGCHSRLEVVRVAARHGLLESGPPPTRARGGTTER